MTVTGPLRDRLMMDFIDAMAALDDMLAEAASSGDSPVALAVVNEAGDLMAYARMDEAPPFAEKESVELAQMALFYGVDHKGRAADVDIATLDLPQPMSVVVREGGVIT